MWIVVRKSFARLNDSIRRQSLSPTINPSPKLHSFRRRKAQCLFATFSRPVHSIDVSFSLSEDINQPSRGTFSIKGPTFQMHALKSLSFSFERPTRSSSKEKDHIANVRFDLQNACDYSYLS
ncbi:PREDICTED: uncharacterized protein LOC108380767 [Rhagoletis zephyria]|uniref:uncharacterized protein LOC108380767 n=1 Tax=Rhagoletis zephyria TaxID=28612 RepID=UPI0008118A1F|nr:PREDICTED: uncharacterized protein LOC108380767 [Rhagoletis zephyria]